MTKRLRVSDVALFLFIVMCALHVETVFGKTAVGISKLSYTEQYGSRVTLHCRITPEPRYPNVYVFWRKKISGRLVSIKKGQGKEGMTQENPSLIINYAKFDDAGQYICYGTDQTSTVNSPIISLTIIGDPAIEVDQSKYEVNYGLSVTLRVSIQSNKENPPIRKVFWKLNNNGVVTTIDSETKKISGNSIENPSLTIQTVTTSEAGNFTCFANHDRGTAISKTIVVQVIGDVPNVRVEKKMYESVYGEDVTINCIVIAEPPIIDVYWERVQNGIKTIINRGSLGYRGISSTNPSLTIIYNTKTHIGTYRCFATNVVGTSVSGSTTLHVKGDKPTVTTTSSVLKANFGDKITLGCVVNAFPQPTKIYWIKRNNDISPIVLINKEFPGISGSSIETPSLTIKYATPANKGYYSCFAENTAGVTESKPINLIVLAALPEVSVPLQDLVVETGLEVILKCSIQAVPPTLEVFWQRNTNDYQTIIKATSLGIGGSTVNNPSLTIQKTSASMSGEYACIARNSIGTARSLLTVLKVEQIKKSRSLSGGQSDNQYPIIDVAKDKYTVVHGHSVTLITSIRYNEKYPVRKVVWEMNNNGVVTTIDSATKGINGSRNDNSSLFIPTVTTSEAGNFTCFVTNDIGTASSKTIVVEVIGDLPTVRVEQNQHQSVYGENVTLNCNIFSDPPIVNVYWEIVDTHTIINQGSVGYQGISLNNPSLTIIRSTTFHTGQYRCFATNAVGTTGSEPMSLLVKGGTPQVTTTLSVLKANYGEEVTLECIVSATPKPSKIYWYRTINSQNHFTYINEKFPGISGSSVETPSLTIKYVTPANEGSYICYARNAAGVSKSEPVKLVVEADLPEVNVPLEPFSTVAGYDVVLKCVIKAVPTVIEVYWQRHTSDDIHTIIKSSTLNIEGSTVSDPSLTIRKASVSMSGEYSCIARNQVGTVRSLPTVLKVEDSESDIEVADHTDTIVNGTISGVGVLVSILALIVSIKKKDDIKECCKSKWSQAKKPFSNIFNLKELQQ